MSGRHVLPSRLGGLYREIAKFGLVGLSGFVINLAVFNVIRSFAQWPTVRASVLATAVAIMGNYLGLRYFTYRGRGQDDRTGQRGELGLFLFFSAIGLVIENAVLYTTTYGFGWDGTLADNMGKFLGIGIATLFRFWSYRTWVFRPVGPLPEHTAAVARGGPHAVRTPSAATAEPVLNGSWQSS
ncbi:GtrA family protein [Streptomyces sp. NPDC050287]|uniref:GtrA family protein n=1 Tax=Streptomyces sp. NPDC050287 TaxID=3365608 RepID=UPI0037A300E9